MKYIFPIIILIFNIIVIGCAESKTYKYEKIDYQKFAKSIFGDYGYSLNYGLKKKYSDIVDIKVLKENLNNYEYQKNVKSKIIQQGWNYYSDDVKNHDIYCLNESTKLVLINRDNYDAIDEGFWHFVIYFSHYGFKDCTKI